MRVSWKAAVGVSISAFLIWWVLRGESPAEIIAQVSSANPSYFVAALLVGTAGFLVRALRWRVLLHPLKPDTRLHSRFSSVSIGFAVNNVLPARVGEFARALALSAVEPIPVSGAFGSLVVERFLDSVVLLCFFLVPMALPSFPEAGELLSGTVVGTVLRATFGVLAIFVVGLVALLILPGPLVRTVDKICRNLPGGVGPRMVSALESFLEALKVLQHPVLLLAPSLECASATRGIPCGTRAGLCRSLWDVCGPVHGPVPHILYVGNRAGPTVPLIGPQEPSPTLVSALSRPGFLDLSVSPGKMEQSVEVDAQGQLPALALDGAFVFNFNQPGRVLRESPRRDGHPHRWGG